MYKWLLGAFCAAIYDGACSVERSRLQILETRAPNCGRTSRSKRVLEGHTRDQASRKHCEGSSRTEVALDRPRVRRRGSDNTTATIDPESLCIIGGIPRHNASGLPFEVLQGTNKLAGFPLLVQLLSPHSLSTPSA